MQYYGLYTRLRELIDSVSVLAPVEPTLDAPIEKCGRLVRRSDLDLLEVGSLALAPSCKVRALYRRS